MPNPYEDYDLYDQILLGTTWSPGIVTLSGHDRKEEWDVQAANGLKGARTVRKGSKPIEFTASFYLRMDPIYGIDEFAEWDEFAKLIESTVSGKTPKAILIYHPDLVRVGIKSVCKAQIGGMTHDGKGGATVVCKFQEYFPPKKITGTLAPPKTTKSDPNAALKAELDKLTAAYKKP